MKKITSLIAIFAIAISLFISCESPDKPAKVTLRLDKETASVEVNKTVTITATKTGTDEAVAWKSDKIAVATVVGGVVTGVSQGSATITATVGDESESCVVEVTKAVTPSRSKMIASISMDDGGFSISFDYNEDKTIKKVTELSSEGGNNLPQVTNIEYSGNTVEITGFESEGGFEADDIHRATLNEDGFIISEEIVGTESKNNYSYNNNGKLIELVSAYFGDKADCLYTWSGDEMSSRSASYGETTTYKYSSYENNMNLDINLILGYYSPGMGLCGIAMAYIKRAGVDSKNLISEMNFGTEDSRKKSFSYKFDEDGDPIEVLTSGAGGENEKFTITYSIK